MKKNNNIIYILLCVLLVGLLVVFLASRANDSSALEATPRATSTPEPTATPQPEKVIFEEEAPQNEITDYIGLSDSVYGYAGKAMDGDLMTYLEYRTSYKLCMESPYEAKAIYLCWYEPPSSYTIEFGDTVLYGGENGMLREFFILPEASAEIFIKFTGNSKLAEFRAFSTAEVPDDVQNWGPPLEKADVLVLSCHSDDDVIFFGALIADCVDRGLRVQTAFLVNHYDEQPRPIELLDGQWELGLRNHPVLGPFEDHYVVYLKNAIQEFGQDNVIEYYVEMLRRFKPSVVVGHDDEGEYGHGAHMLCALALREAVELAADPEAYPESAAIYGVWDTPKTYLHYAGDDDELITIDAETPLASFNGRTAFEVACDAMEHHQTQMRYPHRPTLESEKFERYDCRRFGLIRSLVGPDTGNDIMEHIE